MGPLRMIWERNLFYFMIFAAFFCQSDCASMEVRSLLHRTLLNESYDPLVRPVDNTSHSVLVGFRFAPTISVLNQISQELELKGMMAMTWEDPRLRWDPDNYDGLTETDIIVVKSGENVIWRPELVLNESLETGLRLETLIATLEYNGRVHWYTLAVTTSFCAMNVRYYPFDKQTCSLTFTTWVYQSVEQTFYTINDLITNNTYKNYQISQSMWEINIKNMEVDTIAYDCHTCEGEEQSYVFYSLELRRKQRLVYFLNLVVPCLVMSSMTFLVILLPHGNDSGTAAFGLTCVLTLIVFLMFLFNALPSTGQTILGGYIVWLIVEGVFITFYAVLNSHMVQGEGSDYQNKSDQPFPTDTGHTNPSYDGKSTDSKKPCSTSSTKTDVKHHKINIKIPSFNCFESQKNLTILKYILIVVKVVSTIGALIFFTVAYNSYNH